MLRWSTHDEGVPPCWSGRAPPRHTAYVDHPRSTPVTAPQQPSSYAQTVAAAPQAPAGRPLTLTLAFWLSVAVAVLGLVGGIVDITGGKAAINKALGAAGVDADLAR